MREYVLRTETNAGLNELPNEAADRGTRQRWDQNEMVTKMKQNL